MPEPNNQQYDQDHNYIFNPHGHDEGTSCLWETTESYQREWSFPAFSRASQSVPDAFPPHEHGEQCIYEIIAWEDCSWKPPTENPNDEHNGFCVVGHIRPCKYWKPEQLGPRTCCDFGMIFELKEPVRKGVCLGENCPGVRGERASPLLITILGFIMGIVLWSYKTKMNGFIY